ncbi:hypothetical protein GQ43DRAFT_119555 [Delitschia confertaspora ATCC 74209]|uniref:Uncharacterized protein n=1 Tax=Delitschia confertaspora ATCC 74209 TaxID=1513339 RepID=A0A9P4JJC8_9PLEO|nr:hypothetical protein GQ43DRAFT_119555 [Delitschia confertaspora ATCC 74209]
MANDLLSILASFTPLSLFLYNLYLYDTLLIFHRLGCCAGLGLLRFCVATAYVLIVRGVWSGSQNL